MTPPPSQPAPDQPSPLDAQALALLRELDPDGRHGVFERVMRTYESSLLRLWGQMVEARDRGDLAGAGAIAHTLKSSSASVGALRLSRLCADLERGARDGTTVDLSARVGELLLESEPVLAAVRAMLHD